MSIKDILYKFYLFLFLEFYSFLLTEIYQLMKFAKYSEFPSPFGVLFFFIIGGIMKYTLYKNEFPSPFGVLFFFIKKILKELQDFNKFPSPLGVLSFFIYHHYQK